MSLLVVDSRASKLMLQVWTFWRPLTWYLINISQENLTFRGSTLKLVKAFVSDLTQQVIVDWEILDIAPFTSEVPQGSNQFYFCASSSICLNVSALNIVGYLQMTTLLTERYLQQKAVQAFRVWVCVCVL